MKNNDETETLTEIAQASESPTVTAPAKARRKAAADRDGKDLRAASPPAVEEESVFDLSLRPRSLGDFVGQDRLKKILGMSIAAARQRGEVLDHVLFSGPPGLGKTSLAHIIARELGVNLRATSGPRSSAPATSPRSSTTSMKAMFSSSTRFIALPARSKRFFIPRWRTSSSTSWSAKGPERARCGWR